VLARVEMRARVPIENLRALVRPHRPTRSGRGGESFGSVPAAAGGDERRGRQARRPRGAKATIRGPSSRFARAHQRGSRWKNPQGSRWPPNGTLRSS
jgi:hypothetical protein